MPLTGTAMCTLPAPHTNVLIVTSTKPMEHNGHKPRPFVQGTISKLCTELDAVVHLEAPAVAANDGVRHALSVETVRDSSLKKKDASRPAGDTHDMSCFLPDCGPDCAAGGLGGAEAGWGLGGGRWGGALARPCRS